MKGKKKQVDFIVKPSAAKASLPPNPDGWVKGEQAPPPPVGPQKRLTLNLPADLHTDFKGLCVRKDITIQDKVQEMIEKELAAAGKETSPADTV